MTSQISTYISFYWDRLTSDMNAGLQIFFKIGGPKWPNGAKMASHFLKWGAQAYQINHNWHFCSVLYLQYIDCWWYSESLLKRSLKTEDQLSLNAGQKYCRMLQGEHSAILWPSFSYHLLLRSLFFFVFFEWLLKTCFTVLTTYMNFLFCGVRRLAVTVIHLQFWAYGSWDSLFPISMSPNCKLMSPKHYF